MDWDFRRTRETELHFAFVDAQYGQLNLLTNPNPFPRLPA
jgi:hypothetical protein